MSVTVKDRWRALAACRDEDPRLFAATDVRSAREARDVCRGCPVMLTCRAEAHAKGEPACTWGGQTEAERQAWLRAEAGLEACGDMAGTPTGYERHRRAGQEPCAQCLAADRLYNAELQAKRMARKQEAREAARLGNLPAEDIEARRRRVRLMALEGMTDRDIAVHLGVTQRTVLRDRKAAGIPPAQPEKGRRSA